MMEEASEDSVAWQDTAGSHGVVDAPSHFKHSVLVASIDDKIEDLSVREAETFGLQLTYDL